MARIPESPEPRTTETTGQTYLRIRNWDRFQRYKEGRMSEAERRAAGKAPFPWLVLHHCYLDDFELMSLPLETRAISIMLLMVARRTYNEIPYNPRKLAFWFHCDVEPVEQAISALLEVRFLQTVRAECDESVTGMVRGCDESVTTGQDRTRQKEAADPPAPDGALTLIAPAPKPRPDPYRLVPKGQKIRIAKQATTVIEALEQKAGFKAGPWWGKGLKQGWHATGMLKALSRLLESHAGNGWPGEPYAWLTTVYEAENDGAAMSAIASEKREQLEEASRADPGLV